MLYRRQKTQYLFAGAIGIVGVIAVLFFLILHLPARVDFNRLTASIQSLEAEIVSETNMLERLETLVRSVDEAEADSMRFLAARFIPREQGFAAMLPDLDRLAETAGINRNRVQYVIEGPQFGVYAVSINSPVQGNYTEVTRFIRELESSDTFFILDSMGLAASSSNNPGDLDLSLNLTTFFSHER